MDGIIPPAAATTAQPQTGQQYGYDAQHLVTQLQSKVPLGTTMIAQVVGNDKNGNLIIKANGSDLLLSSPIAIQKGAQLQLKIDTIGGHISAQIISIDGKIPVYRPQAAEGQYQSAYQSPNPSQAAALKEQNSVPVRLISVMAEGTAKAVPLPAELAAKQAQAAARVDQVNLSSPQTAMMKAMVISPSPEIMQGVRAMLSLSVQSEQKLIKTLPSELKPGMEANVKIAGVASEPKSQSTGGQSPVMQAAGNSETPESQRVETANTVLKGQDWMKQDANQQQKPGMPNQGQNPGQNTGQNLPADWAKGFNPSMRSTNGNLQMNALVVDSMREGEMLVETKLGLLRVDGKQTIFPRGTELLLEMTEFTKTEIPKKAANELPRLSHEWPALKTALAENKHEAAKLAGVDHNFAGKLAAFLNAVQNGDAESWLGAEFLDQMDDAARNLLVNKLNGDFANFRNLMAENPANNWQTLLFPIFDGQELNQARLHVKKFKDESAASVDGFGTRFIVELETTLYGEMQFDGLVRRQVPQKTFDLMIRTLAPLEDESRLEIIGIFNTTQEITGFKGGIDFAHGPHFPLEPWKELMNKKGPHDNLIS